MNLEAPSCLRCRGVRLLHVRRVMDHVESLGKRPYAWRVRPVAVGNRAIGHFELLLCRGCGYTSWYAFDLQELAPVMTRGTCFGCRARTDPFKRDAVEHTPYGAARAVVVLDALEHTICSACAHVTWEARTFDNVADHTAYVRGFGGRGDVEPCLRCGGTLSRRLPVARESEGEVLPIALLERTRLLRRFAVPSGDFSLRVCKPCRAVEWYANDFETIEPNAETEIYAVGRETPKRPDGGPYR